MDALYRQRGAATAGEDLGVSVHLDLLSRFSRPLTRCTRVFDHVKQHDMDIMCTPLGRTLPFRRWLTTASRGMKIGLLTWTNHELLRDGSFLRPAHAGFHRYEP